MNKLKGIKDKIIYLPLILGGTPYPTPKGLPGNGTINTIINFALNLLITIGIVAAVIFLLLGAVKWITSGGDKAKVEAARGTITYAIVGLLVIVFSIAIIRIVGEVIGSPALQFIFPGKTGCPSYHVCTLPPTPTPTPCTIHPITNQCI